MKFKKSKKVFIHVDCDSFFAECEILKNPNLKGNYVLV
jgi:nucleotidyltransferase/DNA polymerase involved in DNA repair